MAKLKTNPKDHLTDAEWAQVSNLTNAIILLGDIQDTYIKHAELIFAGKAEFCFDLKRCVKVISANAASLVKMVNTHAPGKTDDFAHDADVLRAVVDQVLFKDCSK